MSEHRVNGADLLTEVETFIRRFCILPSDHAYTAVTLWAGHTHFIAQLETTARLACLSPEPGSGKTRVLEVLDTLAHQPLLALDLSMAAFFRIVEDRRPTILLDEVDAIFTGKAKSESTEDLRRVLNNGYRIGAVVQRVGGTNRDQVLEFRVFAPVAMAGLGNLPDTLMSRSVVLNMKRRRPGETVQPWRDRLQRPEGEALQTRLTEWTEQVGSLAYPVLPEGVEDRDAEAWEPLVMVADAAGGDWPRRARAACKSFVESKPQSSVSLGIRLLSDLRDIWPQGQSVMFTTDILSELSALDEAPWSDLYGEGLKPRKLAQMLSDYGARSADVRVGDINRKGYRREDLWDAWQRYLPSRDPQKRDIRDKSDVAGQSGNKNATLPESSATESATPRQKRDTENAADLRKREPVAHVADVTDSQITNGPRVPNPPVQQTQDPLSEVGSSGANGSSGSDREQRSATRQEHLKITRQHRAEVGHSKLTAKALAERTGWDLQHAASMLIQLQKQEVTTPR